MQRYEPVQQQEYASSEDSAEEHIGFLQETKEPVTVKYNHTEDPRRQNGCLKTIFSIIWLALTFLVVGTGVVRLVINSLPTKTAPESPQKAIVLASYSGQDTSWLDEISPESVHIDLISQTHSYPPLISPQNPNTKPS